MLASIKSDRTSQWVKNHTETPLHSGPTEDSQVFTRLPQWSLLKQVDSKPDWLFSVQRRRRNAAAGPGWVKASDVGAVDAPTVWLTSGALRRHLVEFDGGESAAPTCLRPTAHRR